MGSYGKQEVDPIKPKCIWLLSSLTLYLDSENYWVTCNHYDHCVEHIALSLCWVAVISLFCDILLLFCSFFCQRLLFCNLDCNYFISVMILSPGFIYWEGREWEDDVYIKYYGTKMPIGLCFYMKTIFTTDDSPDTASVFLWSVWSLANKQNQWCFMEQNTVSAEVTAKTCGFPQRGSIAIWRINVLLL